jgi:hypothetical protein
MTDDKGSATNSGVTDSLGTLWNAVQDPNNQERLKAQGGTLVEDALKQLTAFAKGETPAPLPQQTPPPAAAAAPAQTGQTPPPTPTTATPPAGEKKDEKKGEKEEDDMGWVATAMFNFLPDGVKDWAGTAAIPLVTQGQSLIQKFGRPKISKSPAAYLSCMTGDKITEIPESVFDYSKKILKMLGLGDNPELAEALGVGFISFLRSYLKFIPGVKAFEQAAQGAPKFSDLIGFGTNAQTLLGLFKLAPANQPVEPDLLSALKDIFKSQGVQNIDHYFQSDQMNYGQFVSSYAALGRDMIASKQWTVDPAKLTEDMKKTADETMKKYGISDPDGSLTLGLAAASVHGADLLKSMTSPPPAPPAPAADPPKPAKAL